MTLNEIIALARQAGFEITPAGLTAFYHDTWRIGHADPGLFPVSSYADVLSVKYRMSEEQGAWLIGLSSFTEEDDFPEEEAASRCNAIRSASRCVSNGLGSFLQFLCRVCPYLVGDYDRLSKALDGFNDGNRAILVYAALNAYQPEHMTVPRWSDVPTDIRNLAKAMVWERFSDCAAALFPRSMESLAESRITLDISRALAMYDAEHASTYKFLTDMTSILRFKPQLEGKINPWNGLRNEIQHLNLKASVTADERLFNTAAWVLRDKEPLDLIRVADFANK
ncbi:MAG: hypothetical protein IJK28_07555 [Clostridia bacterium]|nr:hypothetical protein [Clostridia bacterium]